jgi:hypothetical protein
MDRTQRHKDTEAGVGREEDRISRLRELLARTLDLAGVRGVAVVRGDDRPIEWFALDFEVVRGRSRRRSADRVVRARLRGRSRSFAVVRGDDRPVEWFALDFAGVRGVAVVRGDDQPIEWFALDFAVVRGRSRR